MPFDTHFKLTDDLIVHFDPILPGMKDAFIISRYTGFLALSAVTVLELSLKTIFLEFSAAKHIVLGNFCTVYFHHINGKIMLKNITDDYLKKFGKKYQDRFEKRLSQLERTGLRSEGISVKSSYGNLITWRHGFVHEGIIPTNASYNEVKRGFACGKDIMRCLASCMSR